MLVHHVYPISKLVKHVASLANLSIVKLIGLADVPWFEERSSLTDISVSTPHSKAIQLAVRKLQLAMTVDNVTPGQKRKQARTSTERELSTELVSPTTAQRMAGTQLESALMDRGPTSNESHISDSGLGVLYKGRWGTLTLHPQGDITFDPVDSDKRTCECTCLPGCAKNLAIPVKQVIGASLDEDKRSGVKIWYCKPKQSGSGPTTRIQYKLHKTDSFECESRDEAMQLLATIQRHASWGGNVLPPRIVAIVNPHSGQGKTYDIFMQVVLPMLREAAGLKVDIYLTERAHHATEITQSLDLKQVDLLLFVGGDGTTFEGMQGILGRPDWETAVKTPFGAIPTGSGNGLAASLGLWDPVTAAYSACKRVTHPIDVASALQPPGNRYYILLSMAYGFMANLDIGTEHMRWMGEPRFTVGGIRELISCKVWPLRAAMWSADQPIPQQHAAAAAAAAAATAQVANSTVSNRVSDSGVGHQNTRTSNSGAVTKGHSSNGKAQTDGHAGNHIKASLLSNNTSDSHDVQHITPMFDAKQSSNNRISAHGTHNGNGVVIDANQASEQQVLGSYPPGPPLPILSQFGAGLPTTLGGAAAGSLPAGWQLLPEQSTLTAQYFMLHNTTHLALNAPLNPKGDHADGVWELITVNGMQGFSGRMKGAKMLLATDSGAHVDYDFVHTQKVRALVIEPLAGDTTWMVLDGEQVPRHVPVYIEVHPRLCTALTSPLWPHK